MFNPFKRLGTNQEVDAEQALTLDPNKLVDIRNKMQFILAQSPDDEAGVLHWIEVNGENFDRIVSRDTTVLSRFEQGNQETRNAILKEIRKELYH